MQAVVHCLDSPAKCYPSARVKTKACHILGRHCSPGAAQLESLLEIQWHALVISKYSLEDKSSGQVKARGSIA